MLCVMCILIDRLPRYSHNIEYMKIIKDHSPNNYMVIVKFRSQKGADEFYTNYNNTQFNTIEPDVCHLVYVARVDFLKASEVSAESAIVETNLS